MKSLLLLLFSVSVSVLLAQQPGTLDTTFGNNGTLVQKPPIISQGTEVIKVTKEGRILIGTSEPYGKFALTFQIDALLPDGSPDRSFGDNGSAHAAFLADLNSLALLPDGRILAAGTGGGNLTFARFKADGTLDSTFGINGMDSESIGYDDGGAGSLTIQPDGKFLVGGSVTTNVKQNISQLYTTRFLPNGTKDLSYGNEGFLLSKSTGAVTSIALQKDGKIVAGGFSGLLNYDALFHIERYNEDGSYDKSFGSNGIVETEVLKSCDISSIALQDDGKLVATGQSNSESSPVLTVARYSSDGSLDNSFGTGGIVTTPVSSI